MKTLLFLFSFFLTHLFFSQGNLQFNQVYNYSGSLSLSFPITGINYSSSYGMAALVVPNNKVWRVERIWYQNTGAFYINNYYAGGFNGGGWDNLTTPIWLKAGETLSIGGTASAQYSINIVEFNIIP